MGVRLGLQVFSGNRDFTEITRAACRAFEADALPVVALAEFEVLATVVALDAVDVVDSLVGTEASAQRAGHDEAVLTDPAVPELHGEVGVIGADALNEVPVA
jgi:hypothetical protein